MKTAKTAEDFKEKELAICTFSRCFKLTSCFRVINDDVISVTPEPARLHALEIASRREPTTRFVVALLLCDLD